MTTPTWRPDLTDKWTLAEEVARIEGYDRIPSVLPLPPSGRGLTAAQQGRRRVANALAAAGFVETPSFPFTTEEQNDLHGSASGGQLPSIKLANPLDGQAPFLRRSLIPGLLEIAHRNVSRGFTDLALFESGVVFLPEPDVAYGTSFIPPLAVRPDAATLAALDASIPPQRRHVAVLLTGSLLAKQPGAAAVAADLADALDAVRTIAAAADVVIDVEQGERAALHPGRTGVLSVGSTAVGYVGELLPAVAEAADLPGRVIVAELDLDLVLSLAVPKVVAGLAVGLPGRDAGRVARRGSGRSRRRGARRPGRRRRRAARVAATRGRLPRRGCRGRREEPHVRAAIPRARPHAHGGRGIRGEARRRRRRGGAVRRDPAGVAARRRDAAALETPHSDETSAARGVRRMRCPPRSRRV